MRYRANNVRPEIRDNRRLCFYAAVFDQEATVHEQGKTFTEVVRPGCFRSSLQNSKQEVYACLEHERRTTFATRSKGDLLLQEDDKGLFASCWLPDDAQHNAIIEDIDAGLYEGCSFGFLDVPSGARWRSDKYCELESVRLFDVSLTSAPSYAGTEIHLRHDKRARDFSRRLR